MEEKKWVRGHNVVVEYGNGDWSVDRLAAAARAMVSRVDLILCNGDYSASVAAARITRTVPILFFDAFAPIEQGLIDSFARPGRNLTGTSGWSGIEFAVKRLEFVKEIVPAAKRISWLWGGESLRLANLKGREFDVQEMIERAAAALGLVARVHLVRTPAAVSNALAEASAFNAHAMCAGGWSVWAERQQVADFAISARMPSLFAVRYYLDVGGFLSYGPSREALDHLNKRWVDQVDRVLRGADPATIPVERPNVYKLAINLRTAKAMGVIVPRSLLLRADELIE
jgi:putative ABC transport system substrate-binding protein